MYTRFLPFAIILLFFQQSIHAQWDTLDFQGPFTYLQTATRIGDRFVASHFQGMHYSDDFGENWIASQNAPAYVNNIWQHGSAVYVSSGYSNAENNMTWVSYDQGQSFQSWGRAPGFKNGARLIRGDTMFVVPVYELSNQVQFLHRWIRGSDQTDTILDLPQPHEFLQITEIGNRIVLLCSDGFRWSDDNGQSWQKSPAALSAGHGHQILLHGNSLIYYNANGYMMRSEDGGENWADISFFADQEVNIRYVSSGDDGLLVGVSPTEMPTGKVFQWRSSDNGLNWEMAYPLISSAIFKSCSTPVGKRLLTPGGCYHNYENDLKLETRHNGLPYGGITYALKFGPGQWMVYGTSSVAITKNNGRTYRLETNLFPGLSGPSYFFELALVGNTIIGNNIGGRGMIRTEDGGDTWMYDTLGAPVVEKFYRFGAHALLIHSDNKSYLYDVETHAFSLVGTSTPGGSIAIIGDVVFRLNSFTSSPPGLFASTDTTRTYLPVPGSLPVHSYDRLFSAGNKLFLVSYNGLYVSENMGLSWAFSPGPGQYLNLRPERMAGTGDILFADNGYIMVTDDGGDQWFSTETPNPLTNTTISFFQQFGDTLYLSYLHGSSNQILGQKVSGVNLSKIKGRVFADSNNNQVMDPGEIPLSQVVVMSAGGTNYTLTDEHGNYALLFEPFATVSPVLDAVHLVSTPASYAVSQQENSLDFALYSPLHDVEPFAQGEVARPGFHTMIQLDLRNHSISEVEVTAKLVLDPRLQLIQTDPPATLVGDTLVWMEQVIAPVHRNSLKIKAYLPPNVLLGTVLQSTASATLLTAQDDAPENNAFTLHQTVMASFDPNDKTALRGAVIPLPEIHLENRLPYLIRFQNTGNYPAAFVRILDTLEADFNPRTFRLESASHPVQVRFAGPRVLEFFFDRIHLPDSISDEAGSHGFVLYSIEANNNLSVDDSLTNSAAIYFDFNAPVITNTAVSVIKNTTGIQPVLKPGSLNFTIAPNPVSARSAVSISLLTEPGISQKAQLAIFDTQGKKIREQTFSNRTSVEGLEAGTYLVQITTTDNSGWKILIVQ